MKKLMANRVLIKTRTTVNSPRIVSPEHMYNLERVHKSITTTRPQHPYFITTVPFIDKLKTVKNHEEIQNTLKKSISMPILKLPEMQPVERVDVNWMKKLKNQRFFQQQLQIMEKTKSTYRLPEKNRSLIELHDISAAVNQVYIDTLKYQEKK